jgi:hypothetical protein
MPRLTLLTLGTVAVLTLATPANAAVSPKTLPAIAKTLTASKRAACTSTAYRAPQAGFLDVRLRGGGDWDLVVRDVAGRTLGASRAFGGREVVQTWVRAGQRMTAQGCRASGAGRTARTTFRLTSVALPKLDGVMELLRVQGNEKQIHALEAAGLDVTESRGLGWADVVVSGVKELATVVASGLRYSVRIGDLAKSFASARAADRRYATRVGAAGSPLPTKRTSYRTYEDVQAELKGLVDANPGVVRKVVFGTSFQGREISGVEISKNVEDRDGRPVFFLMAVHHAREWPSMEAAMEFAHLLVDNQGDSRIAGLLAKERVVILPLVNPDGFISSRNAFDPGDALLGQEPDATLVEAIAPFGGLFAYRRKNCDGEILPPTTPCELAWGVDNNRNYAYNWGGSGSSADVTSQSYHGPGPRSEPETKAVWNYVRTHEVTALITLHNVAALVLRPPGTSAAGPAPDEAKLKSIGDAMGTAAGYTSEYGYQLYDTSGTTEDDTYAATGGFGYTIEMGPPDGNFHMPYQTGVVDEWTGANTHSNNQGGLREALLIAAGAAADPADHAIITGSAPAGKVLRLHKTFQTMTSPWCAKSVEPVLNIGLEAICLTGKQPPLTVDDALDATTTVPVSGTYEWHVGQSTRPFVGKLGQKEAYELTCEQPDGTVLERQTLVIDRGQTAVLNLGCGATASTFADGARIGGDRGAAPGAAATPSVNGVTVPAAVVAKTTTTTKKPATRAQELAGCNKRAKKLRTAKRRAAARRSCATRFGPKRPAAKA